MSSTCSHRSRVNGKKSSRAQASVSRRRIARGGTRAIDALSDDDASALSQVATVARAPDATAQYDERITPIVELLDAAQIQLDEAVSR